LIVSSLSTATISSLPDTICEGESTFLQLSAATGISPYTLVINGTTYSGITVGQTIATVNSADESIWSSSATPAVLHEPDYDPVELGVKFTALSDGFIKGIRFYKGPDNTGTHTGSLWTITGTLLASATFTDETSQGWQEVRFSHRSR
jgi:hypothetical protein